MAVALVTPETVTGLKDRVVRVPSRSCPFTFLPSASPWSRLPMSRFEAPLEHLHYGSDYPFTPEFAAAMAAERLEAAGEAPGSLTEALRTNTERLFPALGGTL